AICAVLGLLVGSFLNVVIYRLPVMLDRGWKAQAREVLDLPAETAEPLSLVAPRSRCPHCGELIRAWQNVPVLSWLLLRGRCAHCKSPISARYPAVEILSAVLAGFMAWKFGAGWAGIGAIMFAWTLIALTFIDIDHQLLPDDLTLPLLWLGLLFSLGNVF